MRYLVKALRASGDVVTVVCDAPDRDDAAQQAARQGLDVLSVRRAAGLAVSRWWPRRDRFPLVLFSQELISLLDAGLPMVEALETLAEKEHSSQTGRLLREVLQHLYEGRTLSYALEQFPQTFPMLFIATVRASEKTSDLKEALSRYVEYQTQVERVKRQVVSASIYPFLLLGIGTLVTVFLLFYVVPKFSRIYEDIGGDLPFLSRVLMAWGSAMESQGALVLALLAAVVALAAYGVTRPSFRQRVVPRLWDLPVIGERLKIYELSRFYRTLGMLLRSGIPMVSALDMAGGLLSPALRSGMERAAARIREGQSVSQAMQDQGLTTAVAVRLLRVGERSGRMGQMVERTAQFYEDETARWIDWVTRLFEPLLMAAIGIVIGIIVLLLYLPIFELAGSIQ
ncbi:MAG TPA: type II secretion system F family protein [Pelomicrobium sp.]|nr:type II secretion system F family protein [Pelomicrobium sp.]